MHVTINELITAIYKIPSLSYFIDVGHTYWKLFRHFVFISYNS